MKKNQSKWELNLDQVKCPACQKPQPALRKPENIKQLLFGGWTCEYCYCKMDKHGNKIENKEDK